MTAAAEKRQRAKRERREGILAAAEHVFLQRGVQTATMDEIARVAQVSKGALYLHFESKDDLYLTLALRALVEVEKRLSQVESQNHESGRDQFRAIVHCYVNYALEHQSRYMVVTSWLPTSYSIKGRAEQFDRYRESITRVHAFSVRAIERGREDGSLRVPGESRDFALQVWAAAFGLMMVERNSAELARRGAAVSPGAGWTQRFLDHVIESSSAR